MLLLGLVYSSEGLISHSNWYEGGRSRSVEILVLCITLSPFACLGVMLTLMVVMGIS